MFSYAILSLHLLWCVWVRMCVRWLLWYVQDVEGGFFPSVFVKPTLNSEFLWVEVIQPVLPGLVHSQLKKDILKRPQTTQKIETNPKSKLCSVVSGDLAHC